MKLFTRKNISTNESVFGMTDVGMKREGNEDAFLLLPEKHLYIVSDGMGGHNAGEVASQTAVDALQVFFDFNAIQPIPEESKEEVMINAVHEANRQVFEKGLSAPEYSGMGCTLLVAFIDKSTLHVCHVGDSRLYVIDKKKIIQVSTDHSVVMELVQAGQMTKAEARHSYLKNQLTQALGTSPVVRPEYIQRTLKKGDTVLLCTDGLWDMLSDEEIYTIVRKGAKPEEICSKLISKANEAGGNDNITVVIATISGN
ncbi:Stp1/IreP family PP2C-type Ser/Thr phosphatase (plasmid) [Chlorobium phaeovibrioides]|uniref:Stp1/IreP family PP2C-type Ser/Thr phosphatase n=1 Tax=Chlorobium phaeovibrioides TaxID=1094 RepID=A0A5M8I5E7_CHLPH|nr:Stp1/IreP family PP2C-type Ser/Thr phosphatase [Chlorobium phaeovibrioides]KAA6230457.1 Stp1/IreP family PP2C-type Ser/Thr phosphatase [Chlorobium phaeovibrioides]